MENNYASLFSGGNGKTENENLISPIKQSKENRSTNLVEPDHNTELSFDPDTTKTTTNNSIISGNQFFSSSKDDLGQLHFAPGNFFHRHIFPTFINTEAEDEFKLFSWYTGMKGYSSSLRNCFGLTICLFVISLPYYFTTNSTTTFNINLLNTLLLFLNGYLIRRERKRERERKTTSQMNEILISKEARDEKARVSTVSYLIGLFIFTTRIMRLSDLEKKGVFHDTGYFIQNTNLNSLLAIVVIYVSSCLVFHVFTAWTRSVRVQSLQTGICLLLATGVIVLTDSTLFCKVSKMLRASHSLDNNIINFPWRRWRSP